MSDCNIYLIGAGVIAQLHAAAASKLPQPIQLHVTDVNPSALDDFAARFANARIWPDLATMLAQPAAENDIVINATPPFAHYQPTLAALKSGRHVLCEKPLAMNRDEAMRMLELARQKKRFLGCCSCRFLGLSAAAEAKRLIQSGELGDVYHINWINRRNRNRSGIEYQPQSRWFLDISKSGGGVLMDWGPYDFAALIELLEPVRMDVRSAWIARPQTAADPTDIALKTEQHVAAGLLFHRKDGSTIPVSYERAACTHGPDVTLLGVEGTRGAVRWDWLGAGKVDRSFDEAGKFITQTSTHAEKDQLGPHDKPLHYFFAAVHGQHSPAIVNAQALFNFSCLRAIYDAATTGKPQSVFLDG